MQGLKRWRSFIVAWVVIALALVGWLATGAPLPGQQLPITSSDLGNLRLVDGLWGIRPAPDGAVIDDLVPVDQWRGLGLGYSNGGGIEVAVWAGYGSDPMVREAHTVEVLDIEGVDARLWRVADPQQRPGVAMVIPIGGNRHLGVVVWSSAPEGLPSDVGDILAELYLSVADERGLQLPASSP